MKIGFVGLGKMGSFMTQRLMGGGHKVVAFDIDKRARDEIEKKGAETIASLEELPKRLEAPRTVWVMVPAGKPTRETIGSLSDVLEGGDIIIDGGNSYYKDSLEEGRNLQKKGILFLDIGTSGGVWGLEEGYCLMVGGDKTAFEAVEPVLKTLAPEGGYSYIGKSGSGHFIKMVHNGIEYGLLQAYAEGFAALDAKKEFDLNLADISRLWNHGGVIRSWILELCENVFGKYRDFEQIKAYIEDSGEGRWTILETINENIPAPIMTLSLLERLRSRQKESFSDKVVAALRHEFGGHAVRNE